MPSGLNLKGIKKEKCDLCGKEEYNIYMRNLNGKFVCIQCYGEIRERILDKLVLKEIEKGWNPSKRRKRRKKKIG